MSRRARVGDVVRVDWTDAVSLNGAWRDIEDAVTLPLPSIRTYGELLRMDKKSLSIAASLDGDPAECVGGHMTIPRPWVTKIRRMVPE